MKKFVEYFPGCMRTVWLEEALPHAKQRKQLRKLLFIFDFK
jgi:hypothetical protein